MAKTTSGCCGGPPTPSPDPVTADAVRGSVREAYAQVARANDAGVATSGAASCCGVSDDATINTLISTRLG